MDPVNHFEIPADNPEKASEFYKKVFNWKIQPIPEMKYNMVYTTEVDEKFMPKSPGAINGGMYNRGDGGSKHPVIVITVKDIDESLKKIQKEGGKIVFNKRQVSDMGLYAQFQDTEGNLLGIWENLKKDN